MSDKEWYAARTIYSHSGDSVDNLYEERIIVLKASSFDEAISEAEKEANEYADPESGTIYLEFVNVFKLYEKDIEHRTEVYSLMRESNLKPKNYLDTFFDTGTEKTK
jgi:hypothetical protein